MGFGDAARGSRPERSDGAARREAAERGRQAGVPSDIPAPGWRDIVRRVRQDLSRDNVSIVAAGLALYALLATFPALGAAVSIYGLFASPADIAQHLDAFAGLLPPAATQIFRTQLQSLAQRPPSTLGVGLAVGLLVSLWSARQGIVALMTATNIAYKESEERGFFRLAFVSLEFTLFAVLGFAVVLGLAVVVPVVLEALGAGPVITFIVTVLRFALLWLFAVLGLAVVYRYLPDRENPRWQWVTWGSAVAATLWLVGSAAFTLYVQRFATYDKTYGALGGVVVLILWLYLTGYTIVLGAEINAEMERQTERDTTTGPGQPLGERGAYAADTVGR